MERNTSQAERGLGRGGKTDPSDSFAERPVDAEAFKSAMRMLPSGVVIVSSEIDGRPWGLTVSACCAISPSPPKVLVSLGRHTRSRESILVTGEFGIDILQASQHSVAETCATPGREKWIEEFRGGRDSGTGAISVADSLCHLGCVIDTVTEVDDHSVIIGRIEGMRLASEPEPQPLLYFDRAFRSIGEAIECSHATTKGKR